MLVMDFKVKELYYLFKVFECFRFDVFVRDCNKESIWRLGKICVNNEII